MFNVQFFNFSLIIDHSSLTIDHSSFFLVFTLRAAGTGSACSEQESGGASLREVKVRCGLFSDAARACFPAGQGQPVRWRRCCRFPRVAGSCPARCGACDARPVSGPTCWLRFVRRVGFSPADSMDLQKVECTGLRPVLITVVLLYSRYIG